MPWCSHTGSGSNKGQYRYMNIFISYESAWPKKYAHQYSQIFLAVTCIKQPSAFLRSTFSYPKMIVFTSKLTCTKKPFVFKGHFFLSLDWLFRTGLSVQTRHYVQTTHHRQGYSLQTNHPTDLIEYAPHHSNQGHNYLSIHMTWLSRSNEERKYSVN